MLESGCLSRRALLLLILLLISLLFFLAGLLLLILVLILLTALVSHYVPPFPIDDNAARPQAQAGAKRPLPSVFHPFTLFLKIGDGLNVTTFLA